MTVGESFMTVGSFIFLLQGVLRLCQTVQVLSPCVGIFQLSELNFLNRTMQTFLRTLSNIMINFLRKLLSIFLNVLVNFFRKL